MAFGRERIIIASHGEPKAALVGLDDLRRLEEFEEEQEAAMLAEAMATETRFYTLTEVEAEKDTASPSENTECSIP